MGPQGLRKIQQKGMKKVASRRGHLAVRSSETRVCRHSGSQVGAAISQGGLVLVAWGFCFP